MSDAERLWNERLQKLRKFKGLRPLTPEEAEKELSKFTHRAASPDEIDAIVEAVVRGELLEGESRQQVDWSPECDYAEIDREAVLFRNEGEENAAADALEEELLEELLDDDDSKNDGDGVES